MRLTFISIMFVPLFVGPLITGLVVAQTGDNVSQVNPETNSARAELEKLQKKNGLSLGFVDDRGRTSFLSFKKRDFIARPMEGIGYSGRISRDGELVARVGREPVTLTIVRLDGTSVKKYSGL